MLLRNNCSLTHSEPKICTNIHPDAVPPIHAESYHVATDKPPAKDSDKFRFIFSDNLQPIATRGKKARSMLLVDQHCGNGCSIKRAPLSVSYYNKISGGHIWRGLYGGGVLPAQYYPCARSHADFICFWLDFRWQRPTSCNVTAMTVLFVGRKWSRLGNCRADISFTSTIWFVMCDCYSCCKTNAFH